jgi:hypothetical protein
MKIGLVPILMSLFAVSLFSLHSEAHASCRNGAVHTNDRGVSFSCDKRNPSLGEAWRTPTGVVWGEAVKETNGTLKPMTLTQADQYCRSIDAELPTKSDYLTMLGDLENSYYLRDGKTGMMPDLAISRWFWTSTSATGSAAYPLPNTPDSVAGYRVGPNQNHIVAINGPHGYYPFIVLYETIDSGAYVRCIVRP